MRHVLRLLRALRTILRAARRGGHQVVPYEPSDDPGYRPRSDR